MRTNAGDRTSPSLVRTPGNLTDDDLTAINGKRDQLEGKIQERYGIPRTKSKRMSTLGTTLKRGRRQPAMKTKRPRRGAASPLCSVAGSTCVFRSPLCLFLDRGCGLRRKLQ